MAETKTLLVSRGTGAPVPMSVGEYRSLMGSLSPQARRNITVRGKVQGIAADTSGKATEESMSHEEISARIDRGQDPVLTQGDPRRDVLRRQRQAEAEFDVAADSDAVGVYRTLPILGQKLQDAAVGTDVATEYRNKWLEANKAQALGTDMAMMAVGGIGAARLAAAAGMKGTTLGVKGFGTLMGVGAAQDTYMYAQYLADQNLPFRSEDYARSLMTGALINLPLAAGAAARGVAIKAAGTAIGGTGDLLGGVADAYITKAVLSKPGSAGAAVAARTGAAFRMMSKLGRKMRGKAANPVKVFDPLEQAEEFARYQNKNIQNLTAKKLAGMELAKREALLAEVAGWADETPGSLAAKNWERVPGKIADADAALKRLDKAIDGMNLKVGEQTKGIGGRGSKKQAGAFQAQLGKAVADIEAAGFGDVAGWLDELLAVNKEGKLIAHPHRQFGKVVKARLNARLQRAVTGGAAQADDVLREVIENGDIWGRGKAPKIGKALNEAIDTVAEAQQNLKALNTKTNLNDLGQGAARRAEAINTEMAKMRKAYAVLERHKMLTRKQAASIENVIKQAGDVAKESAEAYSLAAKVNKIRGKAAGNISERLTRVQQGAQDFAAQSMRSTVEEAGRMLTFQKFAKGALTGAHVAATVPTTGVMMLRHIDRAEKDFLFNHLSKEIAKMTGAPEYMEEQFSGALGATADADPDVTTMGASMAARGIYYLSSALPKPSYSLHGGLEPSKQQKHAFLNKYAAMVDPVSVAYAALEGRATADMVEAIRVTQQAAYAELSNLLAETLAEATPDASRKTLNGVQMFLGGMDPLYRGDALLQLQSNYSQNSQQEQATGGPAGQFRDTSNPKSGENNFTFAQRLSAH